MTNTASWSTESLDSHVVLDCIGLLCLETVGGIVAVVIIAEARRAKIIIRAFLASEKLASRHFCLTVS
jgi:hypothetical protein